MSDDLEAPQEGVEEVVQSEEVEQTSEAPEGVDSTEGTPDEAPAEVKDEETPEAKEEKERLSRSERRRQAKERSERELREAENARQEAERKLKAAQEAASKLQPPKQDDFDSFDEYQAQLSAYHSMRMLDSREAQRLEAEAAASFERAKRLREQQQQEDAEAWRTQVAEARGRYADFDQVAMREDLPISPELGRVIQGSDVAADIAYHLGKNPEVAKSLSQMGQIEQARAIGRLEAALSAPKPKTISNAPEPINPAKGGGSAVRDPSRMSLDEYRAQREKGWHP